MMSSNLAEEAKRPSEFRTYLYVVLFAIVGVSICFAGMILMGLIMGTPASKGAYVTILNKDKESWPFRVTLKGDSQPFEQGMLGPLEGTTVNVELGPGKENTLAYVSAGKRDQRLEVVLKSNSFVAEYEIQDGIIKLVLISDKRD